ncbi:PoNe immunity protein domain-containing protein [Roseateles koreensis]|uniref:DUF1911 domain-containing protein n=1 Tax=Roseateles koreensis TaxID=2987526 RepID=A0ABT5KT40_9BURK|nr:PoNe immunity protein domain-containing protein [Roseateles koreensis]MDC8786107.1 DUF1911 domain-containing protein [Roseateles koreensis]
MSKFEESKRDWFLTEAGYLENLEYFPRAMADPKLNDPINDLNEERFHRSGLSWDKCYNSVEYLILLYSAGEPVESLRAPADQVFAQFHRHKEMFPEWQMLYWEPDAYQYTLWLLGLAVLFNKPQEVVHIRSWVAQWTEERDQDDPLLSLLFARYGAPVGPSLDGLMFEKPYQHLFDAFTAPDKAQAQKSLTAYLKTWYRGMKDCYWHDRHKNTRHAVHFGYWSFEAGMATLLLDLDDSDYREMQFYPKDLVDYARIHGAGLPVERKPILVKTGQPAPHSGLYAAFDGLAPEVKRERGELLPMAEDLMDPKRPLRAFTWILRQRSDGGSVVA